MRRKELANQKVIRAITLGLAAFMALQSPMTVLADSETTGNDPTSASATSTTTTTTSANSGENAASELVDIDGGVADAAQKAAEEAATAIVGPQVLAADAGTTNPASTTGDATTDAPASTTSASDPATTDGAGETTATPDPEPVAESVLDVINAGAATVAEVNKIYNGESTAIAPSNEKAVGEVKGVRETAQDLKDVVEDKKDVEGDGVIQAAATDVEEIKKDLIVAENDVVASNKAAQGVVDNFKAASDAANWADQAMNKAVSEAQGYIDTINNAGTIPEAQQAKANLDTLITNLTTDMEGKRKLFDDRCKDLAKAQQELLDAEADFNDSIGKATSEVTDAKNKLDAAQDKVDALDKEVGEAIADIRTQNAGALSILEKLETVNKDENADWNHQSELFKEILKNYPAMLGEDAENIRIDKYGQKNELPNLSGEYGKYHYYRVTYDVPVKDENGVTVMDENGKPRVESHVKYFNYDRDDKTQAYENGSSRNIIIYEKSQKEFDAIIYLNNYLKAHNEKMPSNSEVDKNPDVVDGYKVFSYTAVDADGKTKTCYILKKELENNDNFASVTVDGETVYYAKNGNGTPVTGVGVTVVPEPSDEELQALKIGETKQSLVVDPDSVSVSYHLENGKLVKEEKGDYVVTTYTREVTEPGTNYTKERPSNVLTDEQRKALIDKVESDLAGELSDGQSVTLKFKEIRDAESNDTYYELTGSYVPLFKIHINEGEIDEFEDDNDGSGTDPYWVKTGETWIPFIGTKELGYYTAPILTNHTSEKEAKGLNTFLQRIKDAGYTITTNGLDKKMHEDGWNYGCEEIYVWGDVEYTKDGVASITGIKSGEYTSQDDALKGLYAAIQNNLATDGVNGDLTVETIDHLGEAQSFTVLGIKIPYWYDPYEVVRKDKTFTATESYIPGDYTTDSYKKYAAYVEYVKAVEDAIKKDQVLSETTYANAVRMLEVIQNQNNQYNGGTGYLDVKNNAEFNKFINDAKNLLEQYKEYQEQIDQAQDAISKAEGKVEALDGAIKELGTVTKVDGKDVVTPTAKGRLTLEEALTKVLGEESDKKAWAIYLGVITETEPAVTDDGIEISEQVENAEISYEELLKMPVTVDGKEKTFEELLKMPVRDALKYLNERLEMENQKLKAAETTLEELKQDQKQAGEDLQKTIDRLTPRPSGDDDDNPGVPGQPGDPGTGGDGGSTSGTPAAPTRPTAGNRTADADGGAANDGVLGARNGGRGGRGGRAAAAGNGGEELLNIGDEAPALAGSIADATGKKADEEVKKVDNVNIEDADPALASFNDVNEESHDWLWWILALLAGAVTIEEFTRRQRNKKKAAQTETSGK